MLERDRRDSTRAVAPLRKAADAVEVDTSAMTLDEVVGVVERLARERLGRGRADDVDPPSRRKPVPRLCGLPLWGHGDSRFYTFARWLVIAVFGLPYRVRARRTGNLPADGPAIVVANHKSNIDPVMIGIAFDRPLKYMAKKELFRFAPLGWLVSTLGAFPVDRGAGDRQALEKALEVLAAGGVLLMFPEGTRFRDEEIHDFLPGVGMLAVRSGAPVIPIASRGTQYMLRDGRLRFPPVRIARRRADRPQRPPGAGQQGLPGGVAADAFGGGGVVWRARRVARPERGVPGTSSRATTPSSSLTAAVRSSWRATPATAMEWNAPCA